MEHAPKDRRPCLVRRGLPLLRAVRWVFLLALVLSLAPRGAADAGDPPSPEVNELRKAAAALFSAGQYELAMDTLRRLHPLDPAPLVLFNITRCLEELGRPEEAVSDPESGDRVLQIPPHPLSVTVRQLVAAPQRYVGGLVSCEGVRPDEAEPRRTGTGWVVPLAGGRLQLGTLGLRLDERLGVAPDDLPLGPFSVVGVVARSGDDLLLVPRGRGDLRGSR